MRTTLDIDDDVLAAAKALSRMQNISIGKAVSQLLRQALTGRGAADSAGEMVAVGGFRPFGSRGVLVTNERINELRDAESV